VDKGGGILLWVFPARIVRRDEIAGVGLAAYVEGLVEATFDIDENGWVHHVGFLNDARLKTLQPAVSQAISKWSFPNSVWGKSGKVAIRFTLNCHAN